MHDGCIVVAYIMTRASAWNGLGNNPSEAFGFNPLAPAARFRTGSGSVRSPGPVTTFIEGEDEVVKIRSAPGFPGANAGNRPFGKQSQDLVELLGA